MSNRTVRVQGVVRMITMMVVMVMMMGIHLVSAFRKKTLPLAFVVLLLLDAEQ